jgi:hypothetical protein
LSVSEFGFVILIFIDSLFFVYLNNLTLEFIVSLCLL